jgi:hypothetical protein
MLSGIEEGWMLLREMLGDGKRGVADEVRM